VRYPRGVPGTFRSLAGGEPIGVFALSGPVDPVRLEAGLDVLRSWGHPVVEAANVRTRGPVRYLAGGDRERLNGLLGLLDRGVRVAIAARGGYGVMRLAGELPEGRLAREGACLVGFSDLTPLLVRLASAGHPQVHGPVVASLPDDQESAERLRRILMGELGPGDVLMAFGPGEVVRPGRVFGVLLGGNLTMLAASVGTPAEADFAGTILALEDINEPIYRIDRLLTQLRLSGRLDGVKALIYGDLSDFEPADRVRLRELLLEAVPNVPVVAGLPFGHGRRNDPFLLGGVVELDTAAGTLVWGG